MILVSHDEAASKLGRAIAYILSLAPDSAAGADQAPVIPPVVIGASDSEQAMEAPPSTMA